MTRFTLTLKMATADFEHIHGRPNPSRIDAVAVSGCDCHVSPNITLSAGWHVSADVACISDPFDKRAAS